VFWLVPFREASDVLTIFSAQMGLLATTNFHIRTKFSYVERMLMTPKNNYLRNPNAASFLLDTGLISRISSH